MLDKFGRVLRFLKRKVGPAFPPASSAPAAKNGVSTKAADDATWLAWQTLTYSGSEQIETAGVTHYRKNLEAALKRHGRLVMAELRIEQSRQYAGAVRVWVGDLHVGAIPAESADAYREVIGRLNAAGHRATCRAELEAGEYVDVWLSVKPQERQENDPFLPPLLGCRLVLDSSTAAYLEDVVLGPHAKVKRVVRTSDLKLRDGQWWATLDSRPLGTLERSSYPALDAALVAGFPLSCQMRIVRDLDRAVRVEVDFPGYLY